MTTKAIRRLWPGWGLRTRLLLAFVLLSVVTTIAVAGVGYRTSRNTILKNSQDNAVLELSSRLQLVYPVPTSTPSQAGLQNVAGEIADHDSSALVTAGNLSAGDLDPSLISQELRDYVARGTFAWQRVDVGGETRLLIGTQLLLTTERSHVTRPSGIEVFVLQPLTAESESIAELARSAWLTGAGGVVLALLLALAAARSVLGPVRELRRAAVRLGEGDLDTRLTIHGTDELAEVGKTFNATAESLRHHVGELERMESDARRFVADVSHELRTPLAAMTAVTDVLESEVAGLPEIAGRAVRLVSQETHNLTRLVNDLIEVTRFDSGSASLALDEVDVAEAVGATLRARGWLGVGEVTTDLPPGVRARLDPRRLDVIVANLVGNALRHGAPPVRLRLSTAAGSLMIEVTDEGPGLKEEVLPHVFDRFYKADTARSRSEGSGLGLAIAWENARLHGGTLTAANRPQGGAIFTVRLPLDAGSGS
ncbi:HAMP domain-containing sensor histidine kinase [Amycolatopsis rhabdoformis]|uniref:Signal transduction histidine-protein kinase/phosphatase MprB n=1 Tax=Amycolatopsis rhabdoformis TaxID=1448059 RepID=A0ABZ1IBE9_9PSEU|nr:HAMP domain-containing sensor histidine kinase [Amycolatopsis rhabdoformis]WSE31453.1 HAMP domain-containing sensor histidine kinase [Amycolatopsis rhabdoformis]